MARGKAVKVESKEPLSAERIELAALELIEASAAHLSAVRRQEGTR